ncbi:MAG: ROK family protein [Spirochaetaceae bacterium]|nr:ROK family protein [Spirochaetaceae bacterium]
MDLGGTKIVVALVETTGEIVAREIIRDHHTRSEDEIVAMIAQSVRNLIPMGQLAGIGVGTFGHVNFHEGVVISNSNLPGFDNYPLAHRMSEELETEVVVDNDANAQGYAEYRFGAGRGFDNGLFVTVSTGLDSGDELCTEVVLEYAHYLGIGLHNVVQTLNPGVIVLGGGLTAWGPVYMDRVRETFSRLAAKTINEPPEIRLSKLGADAAVIGAAALVMTTEEESP